MDTSGTAGLADGIMRGIMMGATVVSSSAGIICALLWKEAMCARRNTPAAAASLSPSNTVSGTLQIIAKQLNRDDSSAMVPARASSEGRAQAHALRRKGEAGGERRLTLGGRGCAATHARPIQPAGQRVRAAAAARCRQRKGWAASSARCACRADAGWDARRGAATLQLRLAPARGPHADGGRTGRGDSGLRRRPRPYSSWNSLFSVTMALRSE